jgi:hypothetical protein
MQVSHKCAYINRWIVVKFFEHLTVDCHLTLVLFISLPWTVSTLRLSELVRRKQRLVALSRYCLGILCNDRFLKRNNFYELTQWSRTRLKKITVLSSHEISCLAWNLQIHYHVPKGSQLILKLSQMNPFHILILFL